MALIRPGQSNPTSVRFERVEARDKPAVLALAARIWEGTDYLPRVFDEWVNDPAGYFAGAYLDGDLIGCGRLMPFDRRRAWLEGLRIHPDYQGLGLGREMSYHLFRYGRDQGHDELLFSTYFRNTSSIRISEQAGFTPIGTFSHLELDLTKPDPTPSPVAVPETPLDPGAGSQPRAFPGIPEDPVSMWNDWLHVPSDVAERRIYFPKPLTVRGGGCTLVLADNLKYPGEQLEICYASGFDGGVGGECIRFARREARERGCGILHTMLPAEASLESWRAVGFSSFEQDHDVFLYACRTSELRI